VTARERACARLSREAGRREHSTRLANKHPPAPPAEQTCFTPEPPISQHLLQAP
jgi:hypothetical protein